MASLYQNDQIETTMFPLTIRTIIKNIDEMTFKCPLAWNVTQLKLFIEMHHKNGSNYLRSDKIKLIYQGRFLLDQEPLAEVLRDKNLEEGILIIAYTQTKPPTSTETDIKISQEFTDMLFSDYTRQLSKHVALPAGSPNCNIKELDLLGLLPLRNQKITSDLISLYKKSAEESKNEQQQMNQANGGGQAGADNAQGGGLLGLNGIGNADMIVPDFNFHFKIVVKLAIFLFIFASYFRGIYLVFMVFLMMMYYRLKVQANNIKRKNRENAANAANNANANAQNNVQGENQPGAQPDQAGANPAGDQPLPNNTNAAVETNNTNPPWVLQEGWQSVLVKFWYKAKEFYICYTFSLFPTWNVEIYLHDYQEPNIVIIPRSQQGTNNSNQQPQPQTNIELQPYTQVNSDILASSGVQETTDLPTNPEQASQAHKETISQDEQPDSQTVPEQNTTQTESLNAEQIIQDEPSFTANHTNENLFHHDQETRPENLL